MQADPFWQELQDFLERHYGARARLVVPEPLCAAFVNASHPGALQDADPGRFVAIAVHKGDYAAFPADFLYPALLGCRPVFANPVFVVLAPCLPGDAAPVDAIHLGALPFMQDWARARAAPEIVAAIPAPQISFTPTETLEHMARLIARDLVRPVEGTDLLAVAETAVPFADSQWFWGDDAAKVAELFCLPALRQTEPDLAGRLIDLMLSLSPGDIIRRRLGPSSMRIESDRSTDFRVAGPFAITFGDLSRGRVYQAIPFNDGRTRPLACFTPGILQFRWQRRQHACDLAASIFAHVVERRGDDVILRHVSTIRRPDDPTRELATVTCTYTLEPGRSAFRFSITVAPAPFVILRDLVVMPGVEELGELGRFDQVTLLDHAHVATMVDAGEPLGPEPRYMCIWEKRGVPGHAVGIHLVPQGQVVPIAENTVDGRIAALRTRYHGRVARRRKPFEIAEDRLVTAGGYYDRPAEYLPLMHERAPSGWSHDPSMSYDTGVELNAVATYLAFHPDIAPERVATLRAWFDRHLALYLDHLRPTAPASHPHERIFVRGLAFAILSLDMADRTFPGTHYRDTAATLTALLLDTQTPIPNTGIFGGPADMPWRPELDSQSAALLALARIACSDVPDARFTKLHLSAAIARGLHALRVAVPATAAWGNDPINHATIILSRDHDDDSAADTGFWTYKLGLALRAFNMISYGVGTGRITLADDTLAHMDDLANTARAAVLKAATYRGGVLEIRTSVNAGETNSETQPWVALGLCPALDATTFGTTLEDDELTFFT